MSQSGHLQGVAPAPPGATVDFINPPTQTAANVAMYTILLVACFFCLLIRLYTRLRITRSFGFDDAFCITAFAFLATYSGLMLECGNFYAGRHIWDITPSMLIHGAKLETWAEWCYLVVSVTLKISYLLFYIRIFGPFQRVTPVLWTGVVLVSLIYVVLLMMSILDCQPINRHWNKAIPGQCLPAMLLAYSSGAFNVATDLFVLVAPMPTIWSMNMSKGKKIRVTSIFGVGIIVVSLSITRLAKTPLVFKSTDPSWDLSNFAIYSYLELSFGFICCCLLTFPAFFERYVTPVTSWLRSRISSDGQLSSKETTLTPGSGRNTDNPEPYVPDETSFKSFNSADSRLNFQTIPADLSQSSDIESGGSQNPLTSNSKTGIIEK